MVRKRGTTSFSGRRLVMPGESAVAAIGLALAGVLVATLIASGWWTARTHEALRTEARADDIRSVGHLLAQSAEGMLEADSLTGLRRLVMDAADRHQLENCRIVLASGEVVADADPARITLNELPAEWDGENDTEAALKSNGEQLSLRVPVNVAGRGLATVEIDGAVQPSASALWEHQLGLAIAGGCGMFAILLVYRRLRRRVSGLGSIGDALDAFAHDESDPEALRLDPDFGTAARSWNRLIDRLERRQEQGLAERVEQAAGQAVRAGGGEVFDAFDAVWHGLVLVDKDGNVRYANGAASIQLGRPREELEGTPAGELFDDPIFADAVSKVVTGKVRTRSTVELHRETGEASGVLRTTVRPLRGQDAVALIVVEDVTQQRVAEESRNAFVAQVTHELRTPLTNIRLYVEQAVDEGEEDPKIRARCMNVINEETRRLERIVGDMLSVAEMEAGSFKLHTGDVRIETLVQGLEEDYRAAAEDKKISFRFELPPKLPVIFGDRDKVALALHNLIGNAVKYTPEGGTVVVRFEDHGASVRFEVEDSGIGISPEECEKIFDRFYRAQDKRIAGITGSGLGLALAREVARLHGGDISVDSVPDKGSTFTLTLPARAEAA